MRFSFLSLQGFDFRIAPYGGFVNPVKTMQHKIKILCLLIGLLVSTGCHSACHKLYQNVRRTVHDEPKCFDYCDSLDWYEKLACRYWHKNFRSSEHTDDFRDGFVIGFSDYVYRGGNGDPPAVPPRRYWCPDTGTRRHQAAEEWFEGFRLGASTAIETGLRERVVVPVSGMVVSPDDATGLHATHGYVEVESFHEHQQTNPDSFYQVHGQEVYGQEVHGQEVHGHEVPGQIDYPLSEVTAFPAQPAPPMSTSHAQPTNN